VKIYHSALFSFLFHVGTQICNKVGRENTGSFQSSTPPLPFFQIPNILYSVHYPVLLDRWYLWEFLFLLDLFFTEFIYRLFFSFSLCSSHPTPYPVLLALLWGFVMNFWRYRQPYLLKWRLLTNASFTNSLNKTKKKWSKWMSSRLLG
jgi:hypothetical protein